MICSIIYEGTAPRYAPEGSQPTSKPVAPIRFTSAAYLMASTAALFKDLRHSIWCPEDTTKPGSSGMRIPVVLGLGAASVLSSISAADTAPIGPGDPTWAIRGVLGYTKTGGNTDNSAGNLLFHAAHVMGNWKLLFGTDARYDDDRFSGFAYQEAVKTGVGYKFIDTDSTKLAAQIGVGRRRLRPEILVKDDIGGIVSRTEQPETSDTILDAGLAFEHHFNASTKVLAGVTMQSGQDNTLTNANVALEVKMSDRLALTAGYKVIDNSNPPPGTGRRDTLTTLGIAYELKNEKLPPE